MTAVLVHGVPETSALWGPLADHLSDDRADGDIVTMHLVAHDWGALLALRVLADRPEHIEALDDPFRSPGSSAALAARTGAGIATLAGCGHWWMLDDPKAAAAAINEFWAGVS